MNKYRRVIAPVFISHQGCPHRCIYCNQYLTAAPRDKSGPGDISARIEESLRIYGASGLPVEIAFYGGTFTSLSQSLQKNYLDTAQELVGQGRAEAIRMSTRPDAIDRNKLSLLKEYAVETVELGAQSLVDSVLSASRRGYEVSAVLESAAMVREFGFKLGLQIMPGLPGDSRETIMETSRRTIEIAPDMVRIYPTVVLKDTPLADLYYEKKYEPFGLEAMVEICRDMYLKISSTDIEIIRMGLQTTDSLAEEGAIVAGPFHPAFGQMVESAVLLSKTENLLGNIKKSEAFYTFRVGRGQTSTFLGQRKINIIKLIEKYSFESYKVIEEEHIGRMEVLLG